MSPIRLLFRLLMGRRLPVTSGTLVVPGLAGSVRIGRDRYGIPLIDADDPRDGPFALGFCHGQDRAFQLEILLRVARGTLSELVGPSALPVDRLSRRVGFRRAAHEQLAVLDTEVRESLEAYARGVQVGIFLGCPKVAHEFALLGSRPTPWMPADTLGVTKLLSFSLTSNWDAELVRLKVITADGLDALKALDSTFPAWHPVADPVGAEAGEAVDRLGADLAAFFSWVGLGGGSNNWVVAGSRTASGRPLLANDPHLDASLPAHWYLARLRTPKETLAGASFVGGPVFLAGHNGHAAWGLTAGLVDNTDLFIEEIGPDGASVKQGDAFVPCRVLDEVIGIKGGTVATERVLITPRGPIVSPILADTKESLSLRGVWLDPLPLGGFFRLHGFRSFAEFRSAFEAWPITSQNMVYADISGTIGYQLVGQSPRRKKGFGSLPLNGADPEAGWFDEGVPFAEMPHFQDPECGFIATANTPHRPEGRGPFLGVDFIDGYRLMAIDDALASRRDWDVASTMRLQMDQHAPAWREIRPLVLAVPATDEPTRAALDLLRAWDGDLAPSSSAATVYELFLVEMMARVARAKAPRSWRWFLGAGLSPMSSYNFCCYRRTGHLVGLLRQQPEGWFARPWGEEMANVLSGVVQMLRATYGSAPSRWAWGTLRTLVLHHPLSRKPGLIGKALARVFNLGPIPCGGDADVVNQGAVLPLDPLAPADNIPSLRMVIDVGAWHNSRFVLPGGQSGNPMSPHYADLFALWRRGEGVPIAFTPEEVTAASVETLTLLASSP